MSKLFVLFWVSSALLATPRMAKLARPLHKTIALVSCVAATCILPLKAEVGKLWFDSRYGTRPRALSLGSGSHPGHGYLSGEMLLADNGSDDIWITSMGYLHGELTFDGDESRLQEFNAYLYYNHNLPDGKTYGQAHEQMLALTAIGFDHYDRRGVELKARSPRLWFATHDDQTRAQLDEDSRGFAASHLHWMGLESPFFSSRVGVGDLGFVKTGAFKQAELDAWAGEDASFSYLFFLTNSVGFSFRPAQDGSLSFSFKIEQQRTLHGDIDFADGSDGGFTALWESAQAEVELALLRDRYAYHVVALGIDLSVFRQRLDAEADTGSRYTSRQNGGRLSVKLSKYWD